ncbi:MAG TPA: amino acid ABC transporter permease [bacterium]|nr:amino acid ABC transporter permease [bacterium]
MPVILESWRYFLLGTYPQGPIGGLILTVYLGVYTGATALAIGLTLGSMSLVPFPPIRWIARVLVMLVRGIPSLVFLFWMYFLLPRLTGIDLSPFQSLSIGLAVYHGSYMAEDIRGGIQAVHRGQREAGYATGLGGLNILHHIILPQAVRAIIPALVNRFVTLFMYTSVVALFGVLDFMRIGVLLNDRSLIYPMQIFGFVGAVYFCFSYGLTRLGRKLEKRWQWAPKVHSFDTAV